jgi:hypothetical protein
VHAVQVGQLQLRRHLLDKGRLLGDGIHAADVGAGAADGDDHAGQPATGAHIHQPARRTVALQRCDDGQTVDQMVAQHLCRVAHGGQVVDLVPLLQQGQVGQQLVELGVAEIQAKFAGGTC